MTVLRRLSGPIPVRRLDAKSHQAAAHGFLERALLHRQQSRGWLLRHPLQALHGFALIHALPSVRHESATTAEAQAVRRGLVRGPVLRRAALGGVTAVLVLPHRAEDYLLGASKQTLRRKIRAAERFGVTWRAVVDGDERRDLLEVLDESERNNIRAAYRFTDPRNGDLLDVAHWLAAFDADGRPVLLAVTPIDGEWAVLRTFRTLVDSPEASAARYLMSWVLVESLVGLGVRYLADGQSPASLPPGLRFFQRILGYQVMRVRLGR